VLPEHAPDGRTEALTVGVRPEAVSLVGPDDAAARLQARVVLVEPLGAKDIVHLELGEHALRAIGSPGRRPRVGENIGVVPDTARLRCFDDVTGLAV
jgi:ABC-type sugar transport system ATPase subunit